MRTFAEAATGLPGILVTAALVVVVCFWLLVALGLASANSLDADADLASWGMGGVPVAVALSLLAVLAWLLGIGAVAGLSVVAPSGAVTAVLRPLALAAAWCAAWRLTRRFVRPLHRLFPDEAGAAARSGARGSAA